MDALAPADMLLFESFHLDRRRGHLLKQDEDGAWRPVRSARAHFDVLAILANRQGALLSKDEIMAAAWPGIVVEDNNLAVQISALRRVLDRNRAESSCIQTVPGRGYRFVAPVVRTNFAAPPVAVPPSGNGSDKHITADEQFQGRPGVPARPDEPPTQISRRSRRGMIAGVIGILFLVAAGVVGWHLHLSGSGETRPAPRLSTIVLPFADLSAERDQQYFADGVTEDLTTDLSRMAGMLVISADTALTYRNKPVDAKQIGRELGVRYVVEGSLERSGNRVRVNAQLIDAEPTRICGPSASTAKSTIYSNCRARSPAVSRSRSTWNWLSLRPIGRSSIPTRSTTFFGAANSFLEGRPLARIYRTRSACTSRHSGSIHDPPRRKPFSLAR